MRVLIIFCLFYSINLSASTFVGNGGHAGDIEVQVAFKEIQDILNLIGNNNISEASPLCTCSPELEGHPTCDILKKLSKDEVKYCATYLRDNALELANVAQKISNHGFQLTRDKIEVEENHKPRAVDAVANYKMQSLFVNQDRFLSMKDYERVFLLTHELGHLYSNKGRVIQDNQSIGPFTGEEGGREFLNAVAAATVMKALDARVMNRYQGILNRSQGHKSHWVDYAYNSVTTGKIQFGVPHLAGSSISYGYYFSDQFGVAILYRQATGDESYLSSTKASEEISAWTASLNYRLFPFSDPLTRFGQSHFVLSAGVDVLSGDYKIADSFIETTSKINSTALVGTLAYYYPLNSNFWVNAKISYYTHNYKYEVPYGSIAIQSPENFNLGVSYGF